MTATDRAFIRVFDHRAEMADLAPHVLFAARGVQTSTPVAATDVPAEQRGHYGGDARQQPAPRRQAGDAATAPRKEATTSRATVTTGRPRPPQEPPPNDQSTYLPSALRNRVDVDNPRTIPDGPPAVAADDGPAPDTRSSDQRLSVVAPEAVPPAEASQEFRAALEVDALRWPSVVDRLLCQHDRELGILCDGLRNAMHSEQRLIAFQSTRRSAGCTTVALATARLLASEGISVAVVDAEFDRPGLAAAVGLAIEDGWERTLLAGAPLSESVIQSLADRISIVPLARPCRGSDSGAALADGAAPVLRTLAAHFDIVLVDAGDASAPAATGRPAENRVSAATDACVLVQAHDPRTIAADEPQVDLSCPLIGVVENLATMAGA